MVVRTTLAALILSLLFFLLTTPGRARENGLVIDEYRLVAVSHDDPRNDATIQFRRAHLLPILDQARRSWPREQPVVPSRTRGGSPESGFMGPVRLNGSLYSLRMVRRRGGPGNTVEEEFVVEADGEPISSFVARGAAASETIKAFFVWQGRLVIEHADHVLVDGHDLNKELGYDRVFNYRIMAGRPIFFFEKDGRVGLSYGGVVQPGRYEMVPHYWCCEPSLMNPVHSEYMVAFFAVREGVWYYVEAGVPGTFKGN